MTKIAVFPGSFDPITIGHESVIRRALPMFDKIIVGVGLNPEKKAYFSIEERENFIKDVFSDEEKIEIIRYKGLTIDFCRQMNAHYIVRGLRTSADFEFERTIAQINKSMYPEIDTVFMLTMPEHTMINSSVVRDILKNGGDVSKFVPKKLKLS
jgi:pantetheine-phosphate adenylyltransferase